jgi:hypothetical protein
VLNNLPKNKKNPPVQKGLHLFLEVLQTGIKRLQINEEDEEEATAAPVRIMQALHAVLGRHHVGPVQHGSHFLNKWTKYQYRHQTLNVVFTGD